MKFGDLAKKLAEVPVDCYGWSVTTEGLDDLGNVKSIFIDYDQGTPDGCGCCYSEPRIHIRGTDLPIEQFPNGVWYPEWKPKWWDEYKDVKQRGLLPWTEDQVR